MKRIMLELSEELGAAIDAALAGRQRNPTLEAWLWRVSEIQDAAKRLGVRKPVRRGRGRPRKPPACPALEVPVEQADVQRCVREARKAALFVTSELKRVQAHIAAIQSMCEHPASEQVTAKDYSGCSSTLCKVCGLDR